jgi:hypothetical protein
MTHFWPCAASSPSLCFVLFSISLPGGTLSAFATIPIDIVVANIQKASSAGKKVSVMEIFQAQVQFSLLSSEAAEIHCCCVSFSHEVFL